ncbi:MAG: hypothetical protein GXO03_01980 [Aquificae bacterium]|nr:hypothetical protein [Aquificota bacterium]
MQMYTDGERVFIAKDYRVEGISKRDWLEKGEKTVVWQSARLTETPRLLTNTRFYLFGAGGTYLIRMDRRSGETVEIDFEKEIVDLTSDLRDVYFVTHEGIYKLDAERFEKAKIERLVVSDLIDKPIKTLDLVDDYLFVSAGEWLYKIRRDGEKLGEKALVDVRKVLADYEGPVVVTEDKVIYFTDEMDTLANGFYEGEYLKAEHGAYQTWLLSTTHFSVFGRTGERIAHVEQAHYVTFTEGLNHIYYYDEKEQDLTYAHKRDLLGDDFVTIDLTEVLKILFASLMAVEEAGYKVRIKEERGFIDVRVKDRPVDMEKLFFRLSKFFPELFYLYKNPGYYDEIDAFAEEYGLFQKEGKELKLNQELLEQFAQVRQDFHALKEDIVREVLAAAGVKGGV